MYVCVYIYIFLQFSRSVMSDSVGPHRLQHARPPYPLPTPMAKAFLKKFVMFL